MKVKKMEDFQKNKVKIYLEDVEDDFSKYIDSNGYFCFLYKKEISKYKLKDKEEITIKTFEKILDNQKSRTSNKAAAILMRSSKTIKGLRDKLLLDGYNIFLIEEEISKMISYGYLNDKRFAELYIDSNKNKKSIKVIKMTLIQKGIDRNIVEELLLEEDDKQDKLVKDLINKKLKGREWDSLDYKEKSKIKAYLYSKGFKFNGFDE